MGRQPCCTKEGINRGAWTATEDRILVSYIKAHGEGKWRTLPKRAGLNRCGKSCRLRWLNYLRPGIKRGNISNEEEELIIRLHRVLGNRWSLIAGRLPGRTDNEIKNYWNTTLEKKVYGQSSKVYKPKPTGKSKRNNSKPNPPTSSTDTSVIRTKAQRWTKDVHQDQHISQPLELDSKSPQSPSRISEHNASSDQKMELDAMNSIEPDSLEALGVGAQTSVEAIREEDYNVGVMESPSDDVILFDGVRLEDWLAIDYCGPEFSLDDQSYVSFLESEEAWF